MHEELAANKWTEDYFFFLMQCWASETDTIMKCVSWKEAAAEESEAATMRASSVSSPQKKDIKILKM